MARESRRRRHSDKGGAKDASGKEGGGHRAHCGRRTDGSPTTRVRPDKGKDQQMELRHKPCTQGGDKWGQREPEITESLSTGPGPSPAAGTAPRMQQALGESQFITNAVL